MADPAAAIKAATNHFTQALQMGGNWTQMNTMAKELAVLKLDDEFAEEMNEMWEERQKESSKPIDIQVDIAEQEEQPSKRRKPNSNREQAGSTPRGKPPANNNNSPPGDNGNGNENKKGANRSELDKLVSEATK